MEILGVHAESRNTCAHIYGIERDPRPAPRPDCSHAAELIAERGVFADVLFRYCPVCGQKLF